MNQSKVRSGRQWLRWRASGAVGSLNENPDHDEFLAMAARASLQGEKLLAGIMRVEAGNDRRSMKKRHRPNLGPYSSSNAKRCLDCGKLGKTWDNNSECVPVQ